MFWLSQTTLLGIPRLSHLKLKPHWPQQNYCGIILFYIMASNQKQLLIKEEILRVS